MSTRATVWLRSEKQNITRYLYHHCDGYMLDEELDPILKGLDDNNWFIPDIMKAITDYDDAYREKDEVGWDSEYVYKIDVDNHTLTKYECGIKDTTNGDRCEEKTQEKYLEKTYEYSSVMFDDPATKAQVIKIQLLELIKYACGCIERGVVDGEDADKIQEIFKIIHRN